MAAEDVGGLPAALQTLQDGAALRGGQRAVCTVQWHRLRRAVCQVGHEGGQAAATQAQQ